MGILKQARTFKTQNQKGTLLWKSVLHIGVAMRNEPPAVGISHPPLGVILLYPCQDPEPAKSPGPVTELFVLAPSSSGKGQDQSSLPASPYTGLLPRGQGSSLIRRTPSSWAGLLPRGQGSSLVRRAPPSCAGLLPLLQGSFLVRLRCLHKASCVHSQASP